MMTIENIKEIKLVTIEGSTYIGKYKKNEDGTMVISDGMKADDVSIDEDLFLDYILTENMGDLRKDINVDGHAVAAHTELTDSQVFDFETALRKAEFKGKKAEASIVNDFIKKALK